MNNTALRSTIFALIVASIGANMNGGEYVKTSGISRTFRDPFTLTKDNVQDITARVLKAQAKLPDKSNFYIYFHRKDDRFFEVSTTADLFNDPNSPYSSIDYLSWNLLQSYPEDPPGAGPRRIVYVNYNLDEGVSLRIDGRDMDWALLAADDIEGSVKRSIAPGLNYVNLLVLFLGVATYFFLARLFARLFARRKFKANETEILIDQLLMGLIFLPPMAFLTWITVAWHKFQIWMHNSSSFLWGDVVAAHGEATQLHNNLLWAVVVGLIVSVVANFATARLMSIKSSMQASQVAADTPPAPTGPP